MFIGFGKRNMGFMSKATFTELVDRDANAHIYIGPEHHRGRDIHVTRTEYCCQLFVR